MHENDFPPLYRSADEFSQKSQVYFFSALKLHLILLILAAILSFINIPHWLIAVCQLISLLGALSCSVYLYSMRPDRYWYAGRAVAESIKTITWRYVSRAEPFQNSDSTAKSDFQQKLRAIIEQNRDIAQRLTTLLEMSQITETMTKMRAATLEDRKAIYAESRIKNQFTWYANKASSNRKAANYSFYLLIIINFVAVICAILRIRYINIPFWPTDIFVVSAASLLSWMQAKRFSELASSYSLAANEIGFINEQSLLATTDEEFSLFVGDAENAFSREHTQWVARKDV